MVFSLGMEYYLPVIWALLLAVAIAMYVVLDGFDLGIGILFPFAKSDAEKDQMMSSVAPFWDGNETWLVLGGGGLFVAFPLAYSVVMPALYLPVIFMLLALVFRGVAFEFRHVADTSRFLWNIAFAGGSTLAAFFQGMLLGGFVQGIKVENNAFAGGPLDWATPFAFMCGMGVVAGYALIGSVWLVMKTEGIAAAQARAHARLLLPVVLIFMGIVSLWTPIAFPRIAERWFTTPNLFYLAPVPILTLVLAYAVWRWLEKGHEHLPFFGVIGLFLLGYIGIGISIFPYLVPPTLTVWQTAAAPASQVFMLIGTIFMLPIILGYIAFVYWLFRGKVHQGEGYH
ncbi:cytochrome d ubiquinol oxidase, subunit II [Ancylobacter novellus DSM 506]|uniref:Cytochrome d ubiquinol oxidase, subunit II n=1 Tax=Ancylobacter novellus (strain ATCC 8093 / DSM 506 / JCM 20403 / CCM 1077 / IAM 12100 / NBRC 12443 / NCIMB 10456) TaxID=639283 RepID=D7A4Q4_ANCN5|nr:cytochrome d ubiquinol oxidase subunit II [Ancylobacter novellus]ADH87952.1 cytochrome d ubiquinol oxidase, subunit II [Ancylobacter novellus DSM 506]